MLGRESLAFSAQRNAAPPWCFLSGNERTPTREWAGSVRSGLPKRRPASTALCLLSLWRLRYRSRGVFHGGRYAATLNKLQYSVIQL